MCICFSFSHFIFKLTKTKDVFDLVLIGGVFCFIFIMHDPNVPLRFLIYYIINIFINGVHIFVICSSCFVLTSCLTLSGFIFEWMDRSIGGVKIGLLFFLPLLPLMKLTLHSVALTKMWIDEVLQNDQTATQDIIISQTLLLSVPQTFSLVHPADINMVNKIYKKHISV